METIKSQPSSYLKNYYTFSVLFSLAMSLIGVYMARFGGVEGIIAALFWAFVFLYAYFKRDLILASKSKKWAFLALSSLFVAGAVVSVFMIL